MKKIFLALLCAILSLGAANSQKIVKVKSASEFLRAIAPGRSIELAPGTYDLGSVKNIRSDYVFWDRTSGESELVIQEVEELSISGEGATLVVSSPYARVLSFRGCSTVALRALAMGHKVSEPCMAGVLSFEDCADMMVQDCQLYGSGAVGLELKSSNGIEVSGGAIRGCNSGAVWIEGSWKVAFSGLEIAGNSGGYPLFLVDASNDVSFFDCSVADNEGYQFLRTDSATQGFGFEACAFLNNEFESLWDGEGSGGYFYEIDFEGNSFDAELAVLAEYGGDEEGPMMAYYEIAGSGLALDYPAWLSIDESEPEHPFMYEDGGGPGGIQILKAYVLKKTDNPDTQATRIFKTALPLAEKLLARTGLSIEKRLREEEVNTEAPPYHYEYYASGRWAGDPVSVRVKLIHGRGAIWCVAAYSVDPEIVEPGSIYGLALDYLRTAEN